MKRFSGILSILCVCIFLFCTFILLPEARSFKETRDLSSIANGALLVGVLFLIVWSVLALTNRKPSKVVYGDSIEANNSTVAKDSQQVDGSTVVNNYGEIVELQLGQISDSVRASDLTDRDKKYAELLVGNIKRDYSSTDNTGLRKNMDDLKELIESSTTLTSVSMKAFEVLRKLLFPI